MHDGIISQAVEELLKYVPEQIKGQHQRLISRHVQDSFREVKHKVEKRFLMLSFSSCESNPFPHIKQRFCVQVLSLLLAVPPTSCWAENGSWLEAMLLGLFKNVNGCMSDSPKVVYFWRIRHRYSIKSEESAQLRLEVNVMPALVYGN